MLPTVVLGEPETTIDITGKLRPEDLVKLRREAPLPPEVLEPLAAFRGDVRWHFEATERLEQKLAGAWGAWGMHEVICMYIYIYVFMYNCYLYSFFEVHNLIYISLHNI